MITVNVNVDRMCKGTPFRKGNCCLIGFIAKRFKIDKINSEYLNTTTILNHLEKDHKLHRDVLRRIYAFSDNSFRNRGTKEWKKQVKSLFNEIGLKVRFVNK